MGNNKEEQIFQMSRNPKPKFQLGEKRSKESKPRTAKIPKKSKFRKRQNLDF